MGLMLNPCKEVLLREARICILNYFFEVTDYAIMLKMTKLKCKPAAKLIALELMN